MKELTSAMGPERVFPNSDNDCPGEGVQVPGGAVSWNGGGEAAEDVEDIEGEEDESANNGYYYQPLNQDPDGTSVPTLDDEDAQDDPEPSHDDQVQQVQQRIQAMGLHLPEAPASDEDEDDEDGAAPETGHASIPMDEDHVELVKRTMAAVALPSLGVPAWAQEISEDQWKDVVENAMQSHQTAATLRMHRRGMQH